MATCHRTINWILKYNYTMHTNCIKCSKKFKENEKYWFTLNKGGNPTYQNDSNECDNYCASCMKSVRKKVCKSLIVQRKNEDTTNDAICPWCTKKWHDHLGGAGMYYNEIIDHYKHHLDGLNPKDDNPDFQIREREIERDDFGLFQTAQYQIHYFTEWQTSCWV